MDCLDDLFTFDEDVSLTEVEEQVEAFRVQNRPNFKELQDLDVEQESFKLKYFKFSKLIEQIQRIEQNSNLTWDHHLMLDKLIQEKVILANQLHDQITILNTNQARLLEKLQDRYINICTLQSHVLNNELLKWKRNQQLAGNGSNFDPNHLDVLQLWCEDLSDIIWSNRIYVKHLKKLNDSIQPHLSNHCVLENSLCGYENKLNELFSELVSSAFIIEKQPPQVLKTNTRFSAKVRLLLGEKLNICETKPEVKVSIISKALARDVWNKKTLEGQSSGDMSNTAGTMLYDPSSKQFFVNFSNMQLKRIKRSEKLTSVSVVDEKFALYFTSEFSVPGEVFPISVGILSLPVAVIVHGNQESHALATVMWDNAFAEVVRLPFEVGERVLWNQVATMLNTKFASDTGRPLSDDNLTYLAEKIFRMQNIDYTILKLSWSQFCKESLKGRGFAFWDWFYAIMKLTRDYLRTLWENGYVVGFVSKTRAEDMLSRCATGTFLLRFSDSELGGVTVAWVEENGKVSMLQPFTAKDFWIRSLAERIHDLHGLIYLYPNIPKEEVFVIPPTIENQPISSNGYVKTVLVNRVARSSSISTTTNANVISKLLPSNPNVVRPVWDHHDAAFCI